MKKNIYILFGVIAMTLTACQAFEESIDYGLTAVMESTTGTKTSISSAAAGGYSVLWSGSDKIAVYADDAATPATFTLTGGAGTGVASFRGDVYGDRYIAFYPQTMLSSRSGNILTINLPAEQEYVPGTFANDAYPMAAVTTTKELLFKNLCSVVRISLKGTAMVNKIVFRPMDPSVKVSGDATVDLSNPAAPVLTMDASASNAVTLNVTGGVQLSSTEATDFFIVLPPQVYTDGFTVELYDSSDYYEKFYYEDFTMQRSKVHKATLSGYSGPITSASWLTFTTPSAMAVSLANYGNSAPSLYFSYDTQHWTEWNNFSALVFTNDSPVYICGNNPDGFNSGIDNYSVFTFEDPNQNNAPGQNPPVTYNVTGDIMSLINKDEAITDIPADYCFYKLFSGCDNLTSAPDLPASGLTDYCYASMFEGCENLEEAPAIEATTLAQGCYAGMFSGCSSLSSAPALAATTLAAFCYQNMFKDCSGLEEAPDLLASSLVEGCYAGMFSGCEGLGYVKCLATDISATGCTAGWMEDVPQGGTFIKVEDMHDWNGGEDGMPYEWFVQNSDVSVFAVNYLTFYAGQTQSAYDYRLTLDNYGDNAPIVYYSNDATNWKLWGYEGLHFSDTDMLYICGDNPDGFSKSCSEYSNNNSGVFSSFNKTGEGIYEPLYVLGDVMSLISKDEEITTIPCDYCFCRLFKGTPSLRNAPTLSATTLTKQCYYQMFTDADGLTSPPEGLPATSLKDSCYFEMFSGCSNITYAPELLATTLAEGCYQRMFYGCENLEEAPELPVMTLAKNCYNGMFQGCDIITDTPELPATELAEGCYFQMFQGCDELVNVSDLPATTLAKNCYWLMFRDCTKLATAPDLPATTLAQGCYSSMFMGCTSLTSAPEILPATTLVQSCYYQMFQGCTELTKAPELPAAVLMDACYYGMFKGCSKLNTIKCLATNIDAAHCTDMWVDGVSSSGCFIKDPDMTAWSTGNSGIPTDWIVMNDGDTPGGGSEGTSEEEWN